MRRDRRTPPILLLLACLLGLGIASGCGNVPIQVGNRETQTPTVVAPTQSPEERNLIQAATAPATLNALTIPQVANQVRPAVVQVTNEQNVRPEQFNRPVPEAVGIGSGVIYDPSGLILTNNHVVAGASRLIVGLPDGRTFTGSLLGADPLTDLAVIRIQGPNLPVATLGSTSSLAVGDTVVVIGNALALAGGPTVTSGIVSALGRAIAVPSTGPGGPSTATPGTPSPGAAEAVFLYDLIQTDAPINPGNSGGPLVNMAAQVVGISTLVAASTPSGTPVAGIGFAISIDQAKTIAAQIVMTGHAIHPFLGIHYVPLNPALAAQLNAPVDRGTFVTAVDPNSPADKAGIKPGDIIVNIGGQQLTADSSLAVIVNSHKPGDTIQVTYLRNGQPHTVAVTLGQQPAA